MRFFILSLAAVLITSSHAPLASAQAGALTTNLSLGSKGPQVLSLQKLLNRDPGTRIAATGPGSPGNETEHFGPLTRAAVVRFQNKHAKDILAPSGLSNGNGFVGAYTRTKLNDLSLAVTPQTTGVHTTVPAISPAAAATSSVRTEQSSAAYRVKEGERIDLYAGDRLVSGIQDRIMSIVNEAIVSRVASRDTTTITLPTVLPSELPGVTIGAPSPRAGVPGTRVSLFGAGITAQSAVYFGNEYIVRTVKRDSSGNYSFVVPPIPPGSYDIAVRTGNAVSNTTIFVVNAAKKTSIRVLKVAPNPVRYGGTLTITGSGFTTKNNTVVTTVQKFTGVPSADGATLSISLTPEHLREYTRVSNGSASMPVSLYVTNENGVSETSDVFTLIL